jgi:hypothetical protein
LEGEYRTDTSRPFHSAAILSASASFRALKSRVPE